MNSSTKQKNIFEPTWPTEYHGLIKMVVESSANKKLGFKGTILDGVEISPEIIFEKLRLAAKGFKNLADSEIQSGDHSLIADFYNNMSKAFTILSNDCIFKLDKNTSVKINALTDTVLAKLKTC